MTVLPESPAPQPAPGGAPIPTKTETPMSETTRPSPDAPQDVAQKYDSELASPPLQREVASVSPSELKAGATERPAAAPAAEDHRGIQEGEGFLPRTHHQFRAA